MLKIIIIPLVLTLLFSCAINKKDTQKTYVLAKEYSEFMKGEVTLISKESDKLDCDKRKLIGVRLNGKINQNLILNCVGCILTATKEKGIYSIQCLCNDKNENHQLTITSRKENIVVAIFDLNKLL